MVRIRIKGFISGYSLLRTLSVRPWDLSDENMSVSDIDNHLRGHGDVD